jgi:hypothetical protein
LSESLRIFAALAERKRRISPKSLVADIDAILFELSETGEPLPSQTDAGCPLRSAAQKTTASGVLALAAAVLASWGICAAGMLLSDR